MKPPAIFSPKNIPELKRLSDRDLYTSQLFFKA